MMLCQICPDAAASGAVGVPSVGRLCRAAGRRGRCTVTTMLLCLFAVGVAAGSDRLPIGEFSSLAAGSEFGAGWRVAGLPSVEPARIELVRDNGNTVVEIGADHAAGSLVRDIDWDLPAHPVIEWRWRVSRVVSAGDVTTRSGDDFAARLYVTFDVPPDRLSLFDRTKLKIARWIYGEDVPAAAICYVWGNREPVGTSVWSAYTDRVRVIVLRNAVDDVGAWVRERRNVAEDYRQVFGAQAARPSGVVIAADTDQTGESVTAWFGDIGAAF